MTITHDQLDSFHKFAAEKLDNDGADMSWPELVDHWRIENPTADEQAEIYAALDESFHDIENGRHQPAGDVIRRIRKKLELASE